MEYEIPERVSLTVRNGESQADFTRRILMEAARLAGMPLLEQTAYADEMMKSGGHLFNGKDNRPRLQWVEDPSPQDGDPLISDQEWKKKYGQIHTHRLREFDREDLRTSSFITE